MGHTALHGTVAALLAGNGFDDAWYVEGREAIANLFAKTKRCGIYVLHFADGMHYVGQTIDVTRRYVEHRRNYTDIIQLSFKQVKPAMLDYEERRIRNLLQDNGHTLRGVVGIHPLPGDADFDLVMPVEAQQYWLSHVHFSDYSGSRTKNPALRKTFEGKFTRLTTKPLYCDTLEILQRYVQVAIPRVRASEESFWSCSCLPSTYTYARININWQEVFAIHEDEDELACTFQLALTPLDTGSVMQHYFNRLPADLPFSVAIDDEVYVENFYAEDEARFVDIVNAGGLDMDEETGNAFDVYLDKYIPSKISNYRYVPGGDDQVRFMTQGKEQTLAFLEDEAIIRAIRLMNLRLMRLGPSRFKTSHCLPLADHIVYER